MVTIPIIASVQSVGHTIPDSIKNNTNYDQNDTNNGKSTSRSNNTSTINIKIKLTHGFSEKRINFVKTYLLLEINAKMDAINALSPAHHAPTFQLVMP